MPWLERAAQDPAFVEAQLNLGIALQESGNLPRAVAQYRKVLATPGRMRASARRRARCSATLERDDARASGCSDCSPVSVACAPARPAEPAQERAARHHRHAARRSRRRLRRHRRPHADPRRPGARRRAVRSRLGAGADHPAVAREPAVGPLPARTRRPAQRDGDAGRSRRWPPPSRPPASRPPPSSRPSRSTGASVSPAASTTTTISCRAASDGRPLNERPAADDRVQGPRLARRRTATSGSSSGCTSSSRTPRTARRARARGSRRATTTTSPWPIARWDGCSRRSAAGPPPRWWSAPAITARPSASTARSGTASSSTTRRCACRCVMRGPGVRAGTVVADDVSLVDLAPTLTALTGTPATGRRRPLARPGARGRGPSRPADLRGVVSRRCSTSDGRASGRCAKGRGSTSPRREPSCTTSGATPGESVNRVDDDPQRTARLDGEANRWSPAEPGASPADGPGGRRAASEPGVSERGVAARRRASARPDPKDRIAVASRLATVTSGEVRGDELVATLEAVLRDDPANPQAHLRLGFAEIERGRCAQAEPHLRAALDAGHAVRRRGPRPGRLPRTGRQPRPPPARR